MRREEIRTLDGTKEQGINRVNWNLGPQPLGGGRGGLRRGTRWRRAAVDPGTYIVTLSVNGKTLTKPLTVLQDSG